MLVGWGDTVIHTTVSVGGRGPGGLEAGRDDGKDEENKHVIFARSTKKTVSHHRQA